MSNILTNGIITAPLFDGIATGYAFHQSAEAIFSDVGWYTIAQFDKATYGNSAGIIITITSNGENLTADTLVLMVSCRNISANIKVLYYKKGGYLFSQARVVGGMSNLTNPVFSVQLYYAPPYSTKVYASVFGIDGRTKILSVPMSNSFETEELFTWGSLSVAASDV